jgi:simple sugar transport system permease protein
LLVTRTAAPSFIVTLASNYILAGLALAIAQSVAQTTQVPVLASGAAADIFAGQAGQFNVAILWWLCVAAGGTWVLTRRRFGNWILATGGSNEDARRAGVPTARVKLSLFVCTAAASALVGIMQSVQYTTGDATTGQSYVFEAPIVVVIGGVLLTGGYGSIVGVVFGTLIYGFVTAGLFYTGWNTNYAQVIIGALMIIVVLTNASVRALILRSVARTKRR